MLRDFRHIKWDTIPCKIFISLYTISHSRYIISYLLASWNYFILSALWQTLSRYRLRFSPSLDFQIKSYVPIIILLVASNIHSLIFLPQFDDYEIKGPPICFLNNLFYLVGICQSINVHIYAYWSGDKG